MPGEGSQNPLHPTVINDVPAASAQPRRYILFNIHRTETGEGSGYRRILQSGMNIEHFKQRLQDKERELESSLAALEGEGRASGEAEVRDATDDATSSQATSESFDEGTVLSQTLEQVRDALDRIKNG